MKTIVTGGSGFIGSHVVDELLGMGHEVVIYDLEAPHYGQACAFVRGDTRDVDRLTQTAQGAEVIYNIAAEANVNRFFDSPLYSNDITAQATACVLEASRRAGKPRVILASTEWIYGSIAEEGDKQITEETPYRDSAGSSVYRVQDRRGALLQNLPPSLRRAVHHHAVRNPLRGAGASGNRNAHLHQETPGRRNDHHSRRRKQYPAVHLCQRPGPGQCGLCTVCGDERDFQYQRTGKNHRAADCPDT